MKPKVVTIARDGQFVNIPVRVETIYYPRQLRPFRDHYYVTGPDGAQFDNSSLAELRRVLQRRYGKSA